MKLTCEYLYFNLIISIIVEIKSDIRGKCPDSTILLFDNIQHKLSIDGSLVEQV